MRGFRRIVAWFHIGPCPASFASSGLFRVIECSLPMAYAMGFILSPLRGLGALRKANAMLPFPQGAQTVELSNICRFPRRGSARRTGKRPPHYYSLLIWGGDRVTSARRTAPVPALYACPCIVNAPRFRRRLRRMGWQQYSRIWGLSRGYRYILYLKQLTAGMRGRAADFPQESGAFLKVPLNCGSGDWHTGWLGGDGERLEATDGREAPRGTYTSSKIWRGVMLRDPSHDSTR